MRATERVAVLTALQKAVRSALDDARAEADDELLSAYEADGVTKRALRLAGAKVGDHMVVLEKGCWEVCDRAKFEEFALDYGFAHEVKAVRPEYLARAIELLEEEEPEGVETSVKVDDKWDGRVRNVGGIPMYLDSGMEVPGLRFSGGRVKCTQVRGCRPEDVLPLVRQLGGIDRLLLGDGEDSDDEAEGGR